MAGRLNGYNSINIKFDYIKLTFHKEIFIDDSYFCWQSEFTLVNESCL